MYDVVDTVNELLRPGGHVFIMCSAVQFAQWVVCFQEKTESNERGEQRAAFLVDEHDFIMVNAPGHYSGFAHRKSTSFISFASKCFHAVNAGAGREASNEMVRYECFGFVQSRFPGFVNEIDSVERLPPGEQLFYGQSEGLGLRRLRAEQKNINLLRELICRLSKPGDLVVDLFGGTFSTAIACMKIPKEQLRVFIGFEKDVDCFGEASKWCLEEFSRILLNFEKSATIFPRPPSRSIVERGRLVVSHLSTRPGSTNTWEAPPGLPTMSVLPPHIMEMLTQLLGDTRFSRHVKSKTFDQWPSRLQAKFRNIDMAVPRAVHAMQYGLYVKQSKIVQDKAGPGVFARRMFYANDTIAHFYGVLVYRDLPKEKAKTKTYGNAFLGVTPTEFVEKAMTVDISKNLVVSGVGDSLTPISYVGISPLPCCVAGLINDPRYLGQDRGRNTKINRRSANTNFKGRKPVCSTKEDFTASDCTYLVADRTIHPDEKLCVDYGSEFLFAE